TAKAATATTTPAGLTVAFTYNGSATVPVNAGTYTVQATINDANYQGTTSGTLTIAKATAQIALANLTHTYNGTAKAATATTTPAGLTVAFTYNGSASAPVNAGTYTVQATINDANYEGTTSGALTIAKATAQIALANLAHTYNGTAKAATATTTPAGLTVAFTYNGSATVPVNAGTYAVQATINDANYQGTTSGALTIAKATAQIVLANLAHTYNGTAKAATATTTPAGLTVAFTYNGSATAPVNAGTYAVQATINDANYQGTTSGTLTIAKATAQIALANMTHTYDGTAKIATATTTPSGLAVVLTYNGGPTAPINVGTYNVQGAINDANYQGATGGTLTIVAIDNIIGAVFFDGDGDGQFGAGEGGLGDVTVSLWSGDGKALLATTLTADDGTYAFSGLAIGAYLVRETDPGGFASTTPNERPVSLGSGGVVRVDFGDQAVGSIGGVVFVDANGNGLPDANEPGLRDVLITLVGATVTRTTRTDANGNYAFTLVVAGSYSVEETDPTGYLSTTPNRRVVNMTAGGSASALFGDQQVGTISGLVFEDRNGNGQRDPGEPGMGSVTVRLTSAGGTSQTTQTAAEGNYAFTGIAPGLYTVEETDPPGYVSTTQNVRAVSLGSGGAATASFGDQRVGTISGVVFEDRNGNGLRDPGEAGLGGVAVALLGEGTPQVLRTSDLGAYSFVNVTPAIYTVEELDPPGFTSTTPNQQVVHLGSGGAATANFGDQAVGTVSGVVFEDLNGNETRDPGESGIGGVTIALTGTGTSATRQTAGDGSYLFSGVVPGSYTVEEADPPGFASVTPNWRVVSVASGGAATVNFADRPVQTIAGTVFEDQNGNGRLDANEPPIGGVTVVLVREADQAEVATTVTGLDGGFIFRDVPIGAYTVRQAIPAGYTIVLGGQAVRLARSGLGQMGAGAGGVAEQDVTMAAGGTASMGFANYRVGTVSGSVYGDFNGDAAHSAGEPGLGGVRLELFAVPAGAPLQTLTTAGNGSYLFNAVNPGRYEVRQSAVTGYTPAAASLTVQVVADGAATANFPNYANGTVSGTVFNDENGNLRQDLNELGLGGVPMTLRHLDSGFVTATITAGNGAYLFTGIAPGRVAIEETDPPGFVSLTPNSVEVSLTLGGAASANFADLSELVRPPVIAVGPVGGTHPFGGRLTLVVTAQSSVPMRYQWRKDGVDLPGATAAQLTLANLTLADSGDYVVVVLNAAGATSSAPATVTVANPDPFVQWAQVRNLPAGLDRPEDDADQDGLLNVFEFLWWLDPLVPAMVHLPVGEVVSVGPSEYLALGFPRAKAAAGLELSLATSVDLRTWDESPGVLEVVREVDADTDWVRLRAEQPMLPQRHQFLRLIVRPAP
ncbi:MAG: hypothetical protein FJ387_25360, partial [Verrucomicrobia bacterium]|nr:hypothetical protein [Verrucomicrobiota bacterium]